MYVRGSTTISLIVLVLIIGSVFLAGGIFPKMPLKSSVEIPVRKVVLDPSSLDPDSKNSLQLKTLKFKECSESITMDLLLDRTGSMGQNTPSGTKKIERLKEAVLALTNNLSDNSTIGIQSFSSVSITNDVPISYYRDVKALIPQKVNAYRANGNTPTHNALAFAYERLKEALPRFPGRTFNFILVSDGQPVPPSQDPRLFNPNPANEIKSLGINIYTLGIFSGSQASDPKLAELLKSVASKPENYYVANTADDTKALLKTISEKICEGQAQSQ